MVEQQSEELLRDADKEDIAFLVVGDPFGATTHSDLMIRAKQSGVQYKVIHNASILNAVGCCGLQLYTFGEVVSIVFWTDTWKPDSYYDKIASNCLRGLHTLCLLDIKVKEQSIENMMRGRSIYEPPRYMTVNQAASQLLQILAKRDSEGKDIAFSENTICVGLSRVGGDNQRIASGCLKELCDVDLGEPLHSLIIAGRMHPLEIGMLREFAINSKTFDKFAEAQCIG